MHTRNGRVMVPLYAAAYRRPRPGRLQRGGVPLLQQCGAAERAVPFEPRLPTVHRFVAQRAAAVAARSFARVLGYTSLPDVSCEDVDCISKT